MKNPDKKTLLELADHSGERCISVYLPTHRKGHEVNDGYDSILFKNHVQKLRADLQQRGLKSHESEDLLAPLHELLQNQDFWKSQTEGLAVFRSPDFFDYFQSPFPFEEASHVGSRFLLQPLLPLLDAHKTYHVLRLTKNGATLFKADQYAISAEDAPELFPAGIDEVAQYYEFEKQYQGRTLGRGEGNASSRGDSTEVNSEKEHLLEEYFRGINEGIKERLGEGNTPLVLACVEYYQPLYQRVNTYPRLHRKGLTGNFEQTSPTELHQMANELLSDYFVEARNKRIERYQNSSGTDLTSSDLREILEASVTGRVDTLFIRQNAQAWGRFDEENLTATIHDGQRQDDESLIERATIKTLQNGGEAYLVDDADLTGRHAHALVAALFRFSPTPKGA
ncbi:MAG: hypothetical protein H7Z75_14700 [Ferruginibacter sp.]|nr:hypothetical protein [Cytophagales bacterium]